MIANDQELDATLERIRRLQAQVAHLRKMETNPVSWRCASTSPSTPPSGRPAPEPQANRGHVALLALGRWPRALTDG